MELSWFSWFTHFLKRVCVLCFPKIFHFDWFYKGFVTSANHWFYPTFSMVRLGFHALFSVSGVVLFNARVSVVVNSLFHPRVLSRFRLMDVTYDCRLCWLARYFPFHVWHFPVSQSCASCVTRAHRKHLQTPSEWPLFPHHFHSRKMCIK